MTKRFNTIRVTNYGICSSKHSPYSLRDLDEKVRAKFSYINTSGIQRAGPSFYNKSQLCKTGLYSNTTRSFISPKTFQKVINII